MRTRLAPLSTPEIKLEDDDSDNLAHVNAAGTAEGLHFRVRTLIGSKPIYFRPEGQFVDEENNLVYFYWQDVEHGPFRLSCLSLKTGRWTEKKRLVNIKNPWSPLSPTSDTSSVPLPPHRGAADALCNINGYRVILLFGGTSATGEVTSDLFLICLDMSKWWKVDIPDEVSPRMDAKMTFVDNRLYIFGGKEHESYSIANYDTDSDKWTWVVRDEPYPSHVPAMGFAGNAISVYEGAQILLVPGCLDPNLEPKPYNYFTSSQVVLFDIAQETFKVYKAVAGSEFPTEKIIGMNSFVASSKRILNGRLSVKEEFEDGLPAAGDLDACCSVVLALWHDDSDDLDSDNGSSSEGSTSSSGVVHDIPDLWCLNLSTTQKSDCSRFDLREKLDTLGITFASCAVLTDRKILLFGSSSSVPNEGVIDRCVDIGLDL